MRGNRKKTYLKYGKCPRVEKCLGKMINFYVKLLGGQKKVFKCLIIL